MSEVLLHCASAGFEAACRVTALPRGHRASRLHGHSYLAQLRASVPRDWAAFSGAEVEQLEAQLRNALEPLDYNDLGSALAQPTDENIARWLRDRLCTPGLERIGIQSTRHSGVDLDGHDHAHLWRRYVFQSAHRLPNVRAGHKCGRMHGHGFEVILHVDQDLSARDLGIDYDHIDACWAPLHAQLDHACLNDLPGLANPTSEVLSAWIWQRLKPQLPELSWVTVYETGSCGAHFDGLNYRIWKELTLDSAVRLRHAPEGDARRRIHGHTFTLRLHLAAPLDAVMGWTIDFGDVKEVFDPIFARLDHRPLHELPGVADNDTASLARWVRDETAPLLPQLDRVDLYQTPGCGAILSWGPLGPALPV